MEDSEENKHVDVMVRGCLHGGRKILALGRS